MLDSKIPKSLKKTKETPDSMETDEVFYPFNPELHLPVIKNILCCSKIATYVSGRRYQGIWCGFVNEEMFHYAYPLVTKPGKNTKTTVHCDVQGTGAEFILGVPNPKWVFTILKEAFKVCYPDEDQNKWLLWEIVGFNTAVYGHPVIQKAPDIGTAIELKILDRSMGGEKNKNTTNWLRESSFNRISCAVPLIRVFDENEEEGVFPVQYLEEISALYKELREKQELDKENKLKLSKNTVLEALKKAQEETKAIEQARKYTIL